RKWEKDGVERYSTEVVLQKFRGELQMLDSRGQGGDGGQVSSYSGGGSSRSSDFGQSGPSDNFNRGGGGGGAGSRDMDDEIPF
ncbi:MAG TPA: single-stranded DNA-binding protein, partial [Mesorhizobium sp.]